MAKRKLTHRERLQEIKRELYLTPLEKNNE